MSKSKNAKEFREFADKVAKEVFGIDTLETQNSDEKDFHKVSVNDIRRALIHAYSEGFVDAI